MATVKLLFVGSLLCLCCSLGDASVDTVSSIASSVLEQSLPSRVYANVFGHGVQQTRWKRAVLTKRLEDPKSCITQCHDNQTSQIVRATVRNIGRLVALALSDIRGDEVSSPENKASFKKRVEEKVIDNMGPFFQDLCSIANQTTACYSQCAVTKLRSIMLADNYGTAYAFCEPSKNWKSFRDYWNALNCTNSTEVEKPCANKCGDEQTVANVTHLEILVGDVDEEEEERVQNSSLIQFMRRRTHEVPDKSSNSTVSVKYETDIKKNTAAVGPVCKSTLCQIDCYKPIITEKCGTKAYDMFSRMTKVEPRTSLVILKLLNAVDKTSDCKAFQ